MFPILIIIISFIFDGILTNFLPFLGNLSLFTPLLTVSSILIVYPFYRKKEKNYFILLIITGLLYDLFYTNLLFLNAILFLAIGFLVKFIYKNFEYTFIKVIFFTILIISSYEILFALIILVYNLVPITFTKIIYKISHSLLLNILYTIMWYLIIKLLPKKYKKINLN